MSDYAKGFLIFGGILVAVLTLLAGIYVLGYRHGDAVCSAGVLEQENEAVTSYAALLSEQRQKDADHASQVADVSAKAQKEIKDVQDDRDRMAADLAAGRVRYSIPVKPSACLSAASPDTSAVASEPRAELSPAAALAFDSIGADADQVVIERNLCVSILQQERAK